MSILADHQIRDLVRITDAFTGVSPPGVISFGLSSYGYDVRVDRHFKVFTFVPKLIIDPKAFDHRCYYDVEGDFLLLPPHGFALATTVESFEIPRDVLCVCLGKSTYCRCGIVVNVSPLEPEWKGKITIEISNTTPLPAKVYAGEGIAQILFFRADSVCDVSYADKGGIYQGQQGVTPARVSREK